MNNHGTDGATEPIELPKVGDEITTYRAITLCQHFGFEDLAKRITDNFANYKPWTFDGCTGLPEQLFGFMLNLDPKKLIECCLRHDLKYGYGIPGDEEERDHGDRDLTRDFVAIAKMKPWLSVVFYEAVQIGGCEEFGQTWSYGFAMKKVTK